MRSSTNRRPDAPRARRATGDGRPRLRARGRERGFSIIEVMVSLLVLLIGMLGLMKVASVAVQSNQRGQRLDQASVRAQTRLEALRNVPTATLACLEAGSSPSACLSTCQSAGGELQACRTALAQDADAATDSTGTDYTYGFLVTQPQNGLYDILVVTTFRDTSSMPARTVRAFYRTAVYRPQ